MFKSKDLCKILLIFLSVKSSLKVERIFLCRDLGILQERKVGCDYIVTLAMTTMVHALTGARLNICSKLLTAY